MGVVGLVLKHNLKWVLASVLIFAFASSVLSNASSLSQWYSKALTTEFLDVTRVDFVVDQTGLVDKVADVHGTIPRLQEVSSVVSELFISVSFPTTVQISRYETVGSNMATVHARNGTRVILDFGLDLCGYLGLEKLIDKGKLGASYPDEGEAVVSQDLAKVLDVAIGDNLTIEVPNDLLTFRISGITDLYHQAIQEKIRKPDSTLQISPSLPPLKEMKFVETTSKDLFLDLETVAVIQTHFFAIISPKDAAGLFGRDWIFQTSGLGSKVSHYVYAKRESLIEPLNIDKSVINLRLARDRVELMASEVPATVTSDVLNLFETASNEVDLFAMIAGGFMLAALPLYWFVASPMMDMFVERKRAEIALLRMRGLSLRGVSLAYTSLIAVSALVGGVTGAFLQANLLQTLAFLHVVGPEYAGSSTGLMLTLPDISSLSLYVVISLALAIVAVSKITKSVGFLQPAESANLKEKSEKAPDHVGKLTLLLLCLGLAKLILQFAGWNSTVYFRNPPSNPFLAMGLALFVALDNYALTPLAPVFVAYGFAKLISARSSKIGVLLHPFSLLAGLRRRKISFRLLSSEMWRTAASLTLITLLLSYGIGSYVSYATVTDHTWKLAGEFAGADIRIDCLPNATQKVQETIKTIPEVSDYTRIDILMSLFHKPVEGGSYDGFEPLIAIDPETYAKIVYLENAPELREAITNLSLGHIIGLKNAQWAKPMGKLMTSCTFPTANVTKSWEETRFHPGLGSNETIEFQIDSWFNTSVPATIESTETLTVTAPLEKILESYYSETSYPAGGSYVADVLLPHTSQGAMFDFAGFLIRLENVSDIKHDDIKSVFVLKLKSGTDASRTAESLRSSLGDGTVTVTRSEAIGILRKGFPRLGVGLDFTQINRILITAVSFGGVVAIAVTATSARKSILSLIRIRGGQRKDCVALFLPEIALVLFLAGLLGTVVGLILGTGFLNSIADLIPRLFTGNPVQIVLAPTMWYFAAAVLTTFSVVQIVSIAVSSTIDVEAV